MYLVTYVVANLCDSLGLAALPRTVSIAAANMGICLHKDKVLTQELSSGPRAAFPRSSYAAFITRDFFSVSSSFVLPALLATQLLKTTGMAAATVLVMSQLLCPPLMEFINTPLHLLGISMYSTPSCSPSKRIFSVMKQSRKIVALRMTRGLASFGMGGVSNRVIRLLLLGV